MWFLFTAVSVIACYFIAKSKNRNEISWAAIGFLIGIVGIMIILCLKDKEITIKCPHCKSDIPSDATVCKFCQKDLKTE